MYTQGDIKRVQHILLNMAVRIRDVLERHQVPHMITYGTLLGAVRHKGFIPWDDDFDFNIFDEKYDEAIDFLRKELPPDVFIEDGKSETLYFHGWAHAKDVHTIAECDLFPQDNLYSHHGVSVDLYKAFRIKRNYDKTNRLKAHIEYLDRKLSKGLINTLEYTERTKSLKDELMKEEKRISNIDWNKDADFVGFILGYNDSMDVSDVFPLRKYDFENTYFWGPKNADALLTSCYGDYMQLPPEDKRKPHYSKVTFI